MDQLELESRFQPQTIGPIRFTPSILSNAYHQKIHSKISLAEFTSSLIPINRRIKKAKRLIHQKSMFGELDRETNRYTFTEVHVAILIILYGADAISALFDSRFFDIALTQEVQ